jgi:hypothetical protein
LSAQPQLSLIAPSYSADPISVEFMNKDLARSGLEPSDIGAYPISTLRYDGLGCYVIPYPRSNMWRVRIDRAVNKYIQPKNVHDAWWPPQRDPSLVEHRNGTLYIIEGEKKAAKLFKTWPGINVIGIGGVWNGTEKTEDGTRRLLPAIQLCLVPNTRVIVVFDGDISSNVNIQMAAVSMRTCVNAHACSFELFKPPAGKGVDDWLLEAEAPKLADLVPIDVYNLEESRKQLYARLGCQMNEDKLILNELNAKKILTDYFKGTTYKDKRLGIIKDGEVTDLEKLEHDCIEYMQGTINYHYKVPQIRQGIAMALTQQKDLVQELVQSLKWDGKERLATWAAQYLETDFPAYANEWGRILLTSMGLRILRPGTKTDYVCILIGAQGIGKSTFFENLSTFDGHQFYYAVTDLGNNAGDSNRTQGQMFARSVIVDLAEGVIFETKKTAMDRAKQILTQSHDEYRVAYSRSPTVEQRGFIFVGTTNRRDQLGDQTGSRRFLNLHVTKINQLQYAEKLQLLAEVVAKEAEIRASDWYKLKVTADDAPEQLRNAHSHVTDVQELVNMQFHRQDVYAEMVEALADANDLAHLASNLNEMYITAGYLAARLGQDAPQSKAMAARALSALSSSPTFPYKLENLRKRLPQLVMTEGQRFGYTNGIMNAQQMINGYIVTKKGN